MVSRPDFDQPHGLAPVAFQIDTEGADARRDWICAILDGHERTGTWRVRARSLILAFFGGLSLDFSQAVFEATRVEISGFWFFGGSEFRIPAGVVVRDQTRRIFSNPHQLEEAALAEQAATPPVPSVGSNPAVVITVKGWVVFSGLVITRNRT